MVRTLYQSYAQPFARVVCGVPTSWDPTTATTSFSFEIHQAVWSPCNKFIAIGARDSLRVDVLDSTTLQRLQSLETSREATRGPMALTFSPDMRMLICLAQNRDFLEDMLSQGRLPNLAGDFGILDDFPDAFIISWDLQTGGVVSTFKLQGPHGLPPETSPLRIACSRDGKMVGVLYQDEQETFI